MNNASASLRGNMTMSLVEELISFCSELWLRLPMVSTGGGGGVGKNKTTKTNCWGLSVTLNQSHCDSVNFTSPWERTSLCINMAFLRVCELVLVGWLLEAIKGLTCRRSFHFSFFFPFRFLWEALVYGSEEGSLPMVGLPTHLSAVHACFYHDPEASVSVPNVPERNQWRRMTGWQRADSGLLLRQSVCHRQRNLWAATAWLERLKWKGRERESGFKRLNIPRVQ